MTLFFYGKSRGRAKDSIGGKRLLKRLNRLIISYISKKNEGVETVDVITAPDNQPAKNSPVESVRGICGHARMRAKKSHMGAGHTCCHRRVLPVSTWSRHAGDDLPVAAFCLVDCHLWVRRGCVLEVNLI